MKLRRAFAVSHFCNILAGTSVAAKSLKGAAPSNDSTVKVRQLAKGGGGGGNGGGGGSDPPPSATTPAIVDQYTYHFENSGFYYNDWVAFTSTVSGTLGDKDKVDIQLVCWDTNDSSINFTTQRKCLHGYFLEGTGPMICPTLPATPYTEKMWFELNGMNKNPPTWNSPPNLYEGSIYDNACEINDSTTNNRCDLAQAATCEVTVRWGEYSKVQGRDTWSYTTISESPYSFDTQVGARIGTTGANDCLCDRHGLCNLVCQRPGAAYSYYEPW